MNRCTMRRYTRTLIYVFAITMVTGCERTTNQPQTSRNPLKDKHVVFIGPSQRDIRWKAVAGGVKRYLADFTMLNVEYVAPADNHKDGLFSAVRDAIAQAPDVIVLYGRDANRMKSAASEIMQAPIPLISAGEKPEVEGIIAHVDEDLGGAAELLGKNLESIAGEKKSYFLVHCMQRSYAASINFERFMGKARDFRGISLLQEGDACATETEPDSLIQSMFATFPNVGFTITLDSVIELPGVLDCLLRQKAPFVAIGASPALWRHLQSGRALALAGVNDGALGAAAAEQVVAFLTENRDTVGNKVVGSEFITAETLPDFMKRYTDSAGLDLQTLLEESAGSTAAPSSQSADQP